VPFLLLRQELLDGGEDDAARGDLQLEAQVLPALRLHRLLTQQLMAGREGAEQLVVQVQPVGEDDQRRVGHPRLLHELAGVERHREALAAALRVPDDADAMVLLDRADGGLHCLVHGPVLMVRGHLLGHARAVSLEDVEVADEVEEATLLEDAVDERLELRRALVGDFSAVDGAPRHEPLPGSGQRAVARLDTVARDEQFVADEQARDGVLVGLELLEGLLRGGGHVGRVLELDHGQRQAVDKTDDVRPLGRLAFLDRELVDGEPVVGVDVVEVDEPCLVASDAAVGSRVLDVDAFDEQAVEAVVVLDEVRRVRGEDPLHRVVDRRRRQLRVDALERGAQAPREDDFGEVVPLGAQLLRLDVRTEGGHVAQLRQPGQHRLLDVRLDDPRRCHGASPSGPLQSQTLRTPSYKLEVKMGHG